MKFEASAIFVAKAHDFARLIEDRALLIQPFEITCDDDQSYWLVYPENRRNAPKIRLFRNWILDEVASLDEP